MEFVAGFEKEKTLKATFSENFGRFGFKVAAACTHGQHSVQDVSAKEAVPLISRASTNPTMMRNGRAIRMCSIA